MIFPKNIENATAEITKVRLPKPKQPQMKDLPKKSSELDFSTEEMGFYIYKGKVVNIIYPR